MTLTADPAARSTYRATGAAVVLGLLFGVAVWGRPGGRVAELAGDDLGERAARPPAAAPPPRRGCLCGVGGGAVDRLAAPGLGLDRARHGRLGGRAGGVDGVRAV